MEPAAYYEPVPGDGTCRCTLCPHACGIAPGARGNCGVRENLDGVLYAMNFGEVTVLNARPVEWVPLYHVAPGARLLAVGSLGASFDPSLMPPQAPTGAAETRWASPREIIDVAIGLSLSGVAALGGEPFMWLEQWKAIAEAARAEPSRRLLSVALTNGYASAEAANAMAPLLDGVNLVMLGAPAVYEGLGLDPEAPVRTGKILADAGCHVEVTYLGLNDKNLSRDRVLAFADHLDSALAPACVHVASPIDPETAAPVAAVQAAFEALRDRLPAVYLSTIYGAEPATTRCTCGHALVTRDANGVRGSLSPAGTCPLCGRPSGLRLAPR